MKRRVIVQPPGGRSLGVGDNAYKMDRMGTEMEAKQDTEDRIFAEAVTNTRSQSQHFSERSALETRMEPKTSLVKRLMENRRDLRDKTTLYDPRHHEYLAEALAESHRGCRHILSSVDMRPTACDMCRGLFYVEVGYPKEQKQQQQSQAEKELEKELRDRKKKLEKKMAILRRQEALRESQKKMAQEFKKKMAQEQKLALKKQTQIIEQQQALEMEELLKRLEDEQQQDPPNLQDDVIVEDNQDVEDLLTQDDQDDQEPPACKTSSTIAARTPRTPSKGATQGSGLKAQGY